MREIACCIGVVTGIVVVLVGLLIEVRSPVPEFLSDTSTSILVGAMAGGLCLIGLGVASM